MLLKYTVSNFKSIGRTIEFSMFPLEGTSDDRFLSEITTVTGVWKILKRGAFFGPNASGKTSFIDSLAYAKEYITKGPRNSNVKKVDQFKGKIADLEGVTTFQFLIYINSEVYNYGFSLDRSHVHEEWLDVLDKSGSFDHLFDRKTGDDLSSNIEIFNSYAKEGTDERDLAELLTKTMKEEQCDQLFLYKLYENGSEHARLIYSWFTRLKIIYPNTRLHSLPLRITKEDNFLDFLSAKLNLLGTGIRKVSESDNKIDLSDFEEKYNISNDIVHEMERLQNGLITAEGKLYVFREDADHRIQLFQIRFEHLLNHANISFDIDDESDGTQRLLDLLPVIFRMENGSDDIYIIDELDRSLHTKLTKHLVNLAAATSDNSQFIFTTHDVNLLNLKDFRSEEIWFFEKTSNGETRLKPFSDFDVSADKDILKGYLAGRFGAVPVIREGA
ncbi:MAG: ATP-binding protein [Oscillospiraceae bacterium]|nr:ATP-binding protein [Oscillospiraceae bacterium]